MENENQEFEPKVAQGVILRDISSTSEELEELRKSFVSGTKALPESFNPERVITFLATDETPDRAGDIIRVDGGNMKRFMENPVFLVQHSGLPIGFVLSMKKISNSETSPNGKAWIAKVYFPEDDEESEEIFVKYKNGSLRAVSIGFRAKKVNNPSDETERKKIGLGAYGWEILEWEMLELSAAAIPCNPNALRVKSMGKTDTSDKVLDLLNSVNSRLDAIEKAMQESAAEKKKAIQAETIKAFFAKKPLQINL